MTMRIYLFFCVWSLGLRAQYFTKITTGPIANTPGDSRSVNWVDVNQDGFVDCFISNGPAGGQNNTLHMNQGGGSFVLAQNDSIVLDNTPSDGATFGDADNDGDLDAFVANWYNVDNLFYVNNGNGLFTKDNAQIISNDLGYSETAAWGDYDKDGLLDLYVTNSGGLRRNFLYHNDGNMSFTKILSGTIVTDNFYSRSANWTDIDLDGDLDMFVTNENSQNENIYRNDGAGAFTKLTTGPLLTNGRHTMSSSWGDYDNDGDLDVFLANDNNFNALFRNDGNFNFVKILNDTVVKTPSRSFSSAWSDVDNDGDIDLFVTNAFAVGTKLLNYFYINNGAGGFTRNSSDAIVSDSAWSYGCAFGDYDNDGFEDLAVATCRYANIDQPDFLYHNNGNGNNWLGVTLVGMQSNKSAIGAKIRIKAIINGNPVWQLREISSQSSYCGQNDMRAHFGLGNATQVDSIKVEWPLGNVDYFTGVGPNQFLTYTEQLVVTGKEEFKINSDFYVEPNPAHDKVSLHAGSLGFRKGETVELSGLDGKLLYHEVVPSDLSVVEIDITKLNITKGLYFLKWQHERGISIKKVLID